MLTNLEPPPDPTQFWSWKKILAWFLGILTVFITALLLYDEKLEPWDDLKPTRTEVPDVRTNGYLMLKEAWENLPPGDRKISRQWDDIWDGILPWDESLVAQLNPSGRDLRRDLSRALSYPEWQVPFSTAASVVGQNTTFIPRYEILVMHAEAWQRMRAGNPEPTITLIEDLRQLSLQQIKGSTRAVDLMGGWHPNYKAADITAQLLAETSSPEAALARLASCWAEDQWTPTDLLQPAAGESLSLTGYFQDRFYRKDLSFDEDHLIRRLLVTLLTKPNTAQNRVNCMLRVLQSRGMATSPTRKGSVVEELERLVPSAPEGFAWLNANLAGQIITQNVIFRPVQIISEYSRYYLFQERAIRVAIAIKRWQLNQNGGVPIDLIQLIPEYLPAIPADPWNGQSLRWAAKEQIIYAVGKDWISDLPVFPTNLRKWFNIMPETPGLRLVRPAPPPARPAPAPKKSRKPAPKPSASPGKP